MNQEEVRELFERMGAIVPGHFVYASHKHGRFYINKDAIFINPKKVSLLCREIAEMFALNGIKIVIAPASGGIALSQWTAYHLSEMSKQEVFSVYAEKSDEGKFVIKRGYDKKIDGQKVLLIEDVINTGETIRKVAEAVQNARGEIVGIAALCNRGAEKKIGDIPIQALLNLDLESWPPGEGFCPLCTAKIPINLGLGHGK